MSNAEPMGTAMRYELGRPALASLRPVLGRARARAAQLLADLDSDGKIDPFQGWLALGLADEDTLVGRDPGRLGVKKREDSAWTAARVFASESVLAEWALGRLAARLRLSREQAHRLAEDLPLILEDLNWPQETASRGAETAFLAGDPSAFSSALFHKLVPRPVRHDLGAYHTPASLARLVVDRVWASQDGGRPLGTWMDPACGFGVFLGVLVERMGLDWPGRLCARDISPAAVVVSRALLVEISVTVLGMPLNRALNGALEAVVLDDVLFPRPGLAACEQVDVLVGNPPWVTWDRLVPAYRSRIRAMVAKRPWLYDRGGTNPIVGGASDDISALFVAVAAERFLADGGRVAMLLKKTLLTNEAGAWFRALGAKGSPVQLGLVRIEDLSRCSGLFGQGGQKAMVYVAEKGRQDPDEVPVGLWRRQAGDILLEHHATAVRREPGNSGSAWMLRAEIDESRFPISHESGGPAGKWSYSGNIHHGLKHDAEDVFVFVRLEREGEGMVRAWPKHGGQPVLLETERLFRYVKPRHVRAWAIQGWEYVLVVQDRMGPHDEEALARRLPATYAYLQSQSERLARRRSRVFSTGPFYGMFGLGPYTWSPHRLIWSGLGYRPWFAPGLAGPDPILADAPLVPDSGCYSLVAGDSDEMWYLVGLLNSSVGRAALESVATGAKRALSKTAMSRLRLPLYDPKSDEMARLSRLAAQAAKLARGSETELEADDLQRLIDEQAEKVLS